ncbi:hypothetical protein [Cuneatibacter caecimuris]|uniref:Uncharacterized protein n=1 Tax=Cuneatibacter caecimuris TaxID=1796618 RepID=A0A4Q7PIV3_9FIRM|nr:hypothetical protein [Cuneatibacter caecimuris]RZT00527.1 hypothetical protein EV209_1848 [Cuneatibacter caecimuris]
MLFNIAIWIVTIVGGLAGLLSTLYLTVSLFVVLGQKIYRKIKFHASMYD